MAEALSTLLRDQLLLLVLVLTRLSVMMMSMPAVGAGVPMQVRALLAFTLALLFLPALGGPEPTGIHSVVDLALAAAREAILGLLIGLVVQLLISGAQLAGEVAAGSGGLQLGESVDPLTRTQVPTLARLIGLLVTAVMLAAGGHRLMIQALLDSFAAMPPGSARFEAGMLDLVLFELSQSMSTGMRCGAPIVAALLLTNLITGLISRTLPQLNVLAVGLTLNALTLLAVSAIALGSAGLIFESQLQELFQRLAESW